MPDTWEYPWFAAWDHCFHSIVMAIVDPVFAKNQQLLLCREWYMNPAGQIPAYEWNFGDVNPPVQAWAALEVYKIDKLIKGKGDVDFLEEIFQKLIINFTWWANRQDSNENNLFEGGFLGLDNIGVIDRSTLPPGASLEEVDATAWMGVYAVNMFAIALEISQYNKNYEDAVTKFYEHFILIASSLNEHLWNAEAGFYYDSLELSDGTNLAMKVHSIVGLSVLFGAAIIPGSYMKNLPDFSKRMKYFRDYRTANGLFMPSEQLSENGDMLISITVKDKLLNLLNAMLDEAGFLAPGGIRSLSKYHKDNPLTVSIMGSEYSIHYAPGESDSSMFGGNSNWRGPVWFPLNYMLIQTLRIRYDFYGEYLKVSFPTGSDTEFSLKEVAGQLSNRLISIFRRDESGARPVFAEYNSFYAKPENKDLLLFHEYFHGDNSKGLGAAHQTGWTALVAALIFQQER